MFKSLFLLMVMCGSWTSFAIAEDYLIRVDEIGFVDGWRHGWRGQEALRMAPTGVGVEFEASELGPTPFVEKRLAGHVSSRRGHPLRF